MKKKLAIILILLPLVTLASPSYSLMRTILPEQSDTYDLGTTTQRWLNGFFKNILVGSVGIGSSIIHNLTIDNGRQVWFNKPSSIPAIVSNSLSSGNFLELSPYNSNLNAGTYYEVYNSATTTVGGYVGGFTIRNDNNSQWQLGKRTLYGITSYPEISDQSDSFSLVYNPQLITKKSYPLIQFSTTTQITIGGKVGKSNDKPTSSDPIFKDQLSIYGTSTYPLLGLYESNSDKVFEVDNAGKTTWNNNLVLSLYTIPSTLAVGATFPFFSGTGLIGVNNTLALFGTDDSNSGALVMGNGQSDNLSVIGSDPQGTSTYFSMIDASGTPLTDAIWSFNGRLAVNGTQGNYLSAITYFGDGINVTGTSTLSTTSVNNLIVGDGTMADQQLFTVNNGTVDPGIIYSSNFLNSGYAGWIWNSPNGKVGVASISGNDDSTFNAWSKDLTKSEKIVLMNSTNLIDGSLWNISKNSNNNNELKFSFEDMIGNSTTSLIMATSGNALFGGNASLSDFPKAQLISSQGDSTHSYTYGLGIIGEASSTNSEPSIGVGGVSLGSNLFPGIGVAGRGKVSNTANLSASIGVQGLTTDTHAGGDNIAFQATALGGKNNYSFYGVLGDIYNAGKLLILGNVGLGTSTPNAQLSLWGSFSTSYSKKTADYTVLATDNTIVASSTSVMNIYLPDPIANDGKEFKIFDDQTSDVNIGCVTGCHVNQVATSTLNSKRQMVTLKAMFGEYYIGN